MWKKRKMIKKKIGISPKKGKHRNKTKKRRKKIRARNDNSKKRDESFPPSIDWEERPPTYTTPTEGFRSKCDVFEGVVYELSEPKRAAKDTLSPGLQLQCSTWFSWRWCADCGVRLCEGGGQMLFRVSVRFPLLFCPPCVYLC